jgi:hypothetical protein
MSKHVRTLLRALFGLAFLLMFADPAAAQHTLAGEWTASVVSEKAGDAGKAAGLSLSLTRRSEGGGVSQMSMTYGFAEFRGLTREQALAGGPVRFGLAREAGAIECEGGFENGKGSGTFRFTSDPAFVSAMKGRGFDFEAESSSPKGKRGPAGAAERLFSAAALNVTTALADDLLSADFGRLDVDDLLKAAIFKVDSKFMREMKASGFPGLGMEELVKARIFKIDPEFVAQAARMGFDKEPFEGLVQMRIFKVTPEFIAEARGEGLSGLSVEELVKLRIFKIDAEFIRRAKADGVPLEVEELVQHRIGVRRKRLQ